MMSTQNGAAEGVLPAWTPIYQIFCLLSVSRRLNNTTAQGCRRRLLARGVRLDPRLSFWISLCRACHLLDGGRPPRPTIRLPEWWARLPAAQVRDLVRAWPSASHTAVLFRARRRLLEQLFEGGSGDWFAESYPFDLTGLKALGLWDEAVGGLSAWGRQVFSLAPASEAAVPLASQPWRVEGDVLVVPLPSDWALLWEVESYLDPLRAAPGAAWRQSSGAPPREIRYALNQAALTMAARRGPVFRLREVLQAGMGQPLPALADEFFERFSGARLLEGAVLEFASASELAQLRRQPSMRPYLTRLLSRRHAYLPLWQVKGARRALARRNLLIQPAEEAPPLPPVLDVRKKRVIFSDAERAELLFQALLVQQVLPYGWVSLELLEKIQARLPEDLVVAAGQRAERLARAVRQDAASLLHPDSLALRPTTGESEPPPPRVQIPGPLDEVRIRLSQAAEREETLEIWYQKPGRTPEKRRVSPLLVEERPNGWVLVAYCHRRRDNRTFRLDRAALVDDG